MNNLVEAKKQSFASAETINGSPPTSICESVLDREEECPEEVSYEFQLAITA
jgi:hypothetical protein